MAWEVVGVDPGRLDPIFWHPAFFSRPEQKRRFGGEFFPADWLADGRLTFVEFFQQRKEGGRKGLVVMDLRGGP